MSTVPSSTETISHYRLLELLGRGAMGEVWLAEDTQLPRKVAVKLLPRHLTEDRDAVERLLREARAAASVDHPAVVTVYEAGLAEGRPYLVMQRVEGETLEARLARGPLSVDEAMEIGTTVADALAEVHALGIVHRDLKPSNIILTARGPKILDFGLASVRSGVKVTSDGTLLGTPLWMSPEQVRGLPPDNRSDLWSLGVMLYQMLTGRAPFAGDTLEAVTYQLLNHQPPAPSALKADVGPDFDFIVMKLLRKDPAHRYVRAEELIADLTNCKFCEVHPVPPTGAPTIPRLAVLYFEVMSADPDDAYLAAGLTEDLIVDLTRVEGLQVASRGDVLQYRDRPVPPRTLGRELGADYVVLGSVRRAGQRARISAQLVRASDGHTLWGERFDRTLEDLFDVQAEVSKRIVDALQVALKPGERDMLERAPTRSAEAYAFYLKGRALDQGTRDRNYAAEDLFKSAIAKDPGFALAHAALGECYAWRGLRWWAGIEAADQALPCAMRALEIEPDLLEGHLVRAMVHRLRGEPEALLQAIERVIALNPEHADALEWAAWSYMSMGTPQQAVGILERLGVRHPERYTTTTYLMQCYEMLGRSEDAARMYRSGREQLLEVLRRNPENIHARSLLAGLLVQLGEREAGLREMERSLQMAPEDGRIRYNAACAFARLGMPEEAIAQLKEGIKNIPTYVADWPKVDPDLASLHGHPEFVRMFGRTER